VLGVDEFVNRVAFLDEAADFWVGAIVLWHNKLYME
jgi:hypothetical protein